MPFPGRWPLAATAAVLSLVALAPRAAAEPPARPPLPPLPPADRVPWEPHVEVGAGLAFVEKPATTDGLGHRTGVRLAPGVGYSVQLDWQIVRYLRFTGYVVGSNHALTLPAGSLGLPGAADLSAPSALTYTLGARLSPTLPIGSRVRLWVTAGAGWGRVEYGRITITEAGHDPYVLRERAASVVEIPLGLGALFEIIPRWLAVRVEVTGAFLPGQTGDAMTRGQTVDYLGHKRDVGPMPRIDASLVQTVGLSLLL